MDKNITDSNQAMVSLTELNVALIDRGIKAILVRSTDRYFNEYVPKELSIRTKLTGFDGSVGDAIITNNGAHLFVDGRYRLQAQAQAKDFTVHVCENAQSIENAWLNSLNTLLSAQDVLAYDPSTIDLRLFEKLLSQVEKIQAKLEPRAYEIFSHVLGKICEKPLLETKIIRIDRELCGYSCAEKRELLAKNLKSQGVDGFLAVKLDDIAWVTNLRSYSFPFQSAIPGIACIMADQILLGTQAQSTPLIMDGIEMVKEDELFRLVNKKYSHARLVLGIDSFETSKAHELALRALNIAVKPIENPISPLKAVKNEKELLHMRSAFKKADMVVYQTQNYVIESCEKEKTLNESDVDNYVKDEFKKSGAQDLSFRPICASGKNGAIIHYGTPNRQQNLEEGSLFLLDTGAYYEGGYATDLTRTFLAAKKSAEAQPWQTKMFTLVLKASIRGLSARIRKGALGMQLDALVRGPLWQAGLDFAHGTGHGVGINVHEFPPRIGFLSQSPLLEGHVFSIEPGLYFEGLGGVRIENLATLVKDKERPDFLRVLPLTFCPFDERLINEKMLDDDEKEFLNYYRKEWQNQAPWPNLPPLRSVSF